MLRVKTTFRFCRSSNFVVLIGIVAVIPFLFAFASAQTFRGDIVATANWMATQSTLSDWAVLMNGTIVNGTILDPDINPYYANAGVHGFVTDSAYYNNIQYWMDWYWIQISKQPPYPLYFDPKQNGLCNLTQTGTSLTWAIADYIYTNGQESLLCGDPNNVPHPDSTDSYAGTFLSLAWDYYQTHDPGAINYIEQITCTIPCQPGSVDRLDAIGSVVLATLQSNNLTWAKPTYTIEYLADNAEAYRGLQDLASLYTQLGQTSKAGKYGKKATKMKNAITTTLWNSNVGENNFYTYFDTTKGAGQAVDWGTWYAANGAALEIFPIALGVVTPTSDYAAKYVWPTFQSHWQSRWTNLTADSQTGNYPWTIVAYTAALMGDYADAYIFIKNIEKQFIYTSPNLPFSGCNSQGYCMNWGVHEAGYFMRLCALMPLSYP